MGIPTFVVGTGRCGSTMLSNMLREHPHVLSLSEFYGILVDGGGRVSETFCAAPIDGRHFWDMVAAIAPFTSFALQQRIPCDEWLYPCDAPGARFSSQTGVPAILVTALPHLTGDFDALFDTLREEVIRWPIASMGEQYQRLFGWLAEHFGKRLWVERSGAGLSMIEPLLSTFPGGRFVHVVRDGRDAALSMREHLLLRVYFVMSSLAQFLGVDPIESPGRTCIDRVPEELRPFLPERFDADSFRAFRVPLMVCSEFWTQQIVSGLNLLRALPDGRLLTLRYEDFLFEPKKQLDALAAFLGDEFVDEEWSARCAATVRKPRSTWRDLPEAEAHALTEACRPGFEQLRAAGVRYDV